MVYTNRVITETIFLETNLTFSTSARNLNALVYDYVEEIGHLAFGNDFELVKVE
jgi:hypothetical protein